MSRKLPVLCPQQYVGMTMQVVVCSRCRQWDEQFTLCSVVTGAEHLPDDLDDIPDCPIQERCQHQLQAGEGPCVVRRKGLVCESALVFGGLSRNAAMGHQLSFHADTVASPEEVARWREGIR